MPVASTTELVSDMVADIGSVLWGTLPTVLGLVAALIGLFFAYRFIKKQIGRGK